MKNISFYKNNNLLYTIRFIAVQYLYLINVRGKNIIIKSILSTLNDNTNIYIKKQINKEILSILMMNIKYYYSIIDNIISSNLCNNCKICKLPKLILIILRLAYFELFLFNYTNKSTIINDYIQIAKSFNFYKETSFINSILDKL